MVKKYEDVNKGGRPALVFTEDQIKLIEQLGKVLSIEQIADYFCISKTTFYAVMERQPEVSERYKKGKAHAIASVSKSLIQKALAGDTTSAIFYLKTQAGWKETVSVNADVNVHSTKDLTDEQLAAIASGSCN